MLSPISLSPKLLVGSLHFCRISGNTPQASIWRGTYCEVRLYPFLTVLGEVQVERASLATAWRGDHSTRACVDVRVAISTDGPLSTWIEKTSQRKPVILCCRGKRHSADPCDPLMHFFASYRRFPMISEVVTVERTSLCSVKSGYQIPQGPITILFSSFNQVSIASHSNRARRRYL